MRGSLGSPKLARRQAPRVAGRVKEWEMALSPAMCRRVGEGRARLDRLRAAHQLPRRGGMTSAPASKPESGSDGKGRDCDGIVR